MLRIHFFKGYDSKKNHNFLITKGYIPLIVQNKRNIKNKCLLRTFNKKQKKIYKRRHIVENYHSWLKKLSFLKNENFVFIFFKEI